MKHLIICLFMAVSMSLSAQSLSWENPVMTVGNETFELADIDDWGRATLKYSKVSGETTICTGKYYNGKKTGIWYLYNTDGTVISSMKYEDGKRVWLRSNLGDKSVYVVYEDSRVSTVTYYLAQR